MGTVGVPGHVQPNWVGPTLAKNPFFFVFGGPNLAKNHIFHQNVPIKHWLALDTRYRAFMVFLFLKYFDLSNSFRLKITIF